MKGGEGGRRQGGGNMKSGGGRDRSDGKVADDQTYLKKGGGVGG